MIDQTKIEQAAKLYVAETVTQCININITQLREFCKLDFTAGVRFAESEMGQIAQEFAEWCGKSYIRLYEVWVHRFADQRDESNWITTSDLFAMFIKERSAQ